MREVNTKASMIRDFGDLQQKDGEDSDNFFERCRQVCDSVFQQDLPDSEEELKGYRKSHYLMLKVAFVAGLKPVVRKAVAANFTQMKTLMGLKELAGLKEKGAKLLDREDQL
jgi:hypothetical protein